MHHVQVEHYRYKCKILNLYIQWNCTPGWPSTTNRLSFHLGLYISTTIDATPGSHKFCSTVLHKPNQVKSCFKTITASDRLENKFTCLIMNYGRVPILEMDLSSYPKLLASHFFFQIWKYFCLWVFERLPFLRLV